MPFVIEGTGEVIARDTRWLATARAQHAVVMLARGDGIDEVAARVGFRSASAFGTAFHRVTGRAHGSLSVSR